MITKLFFSEISLIFQPSKSVCECSASVSLPLVVNPAGDKCVPKELLPSCQFQSSPPPLQRTRRAAKKSDPLCVGVCASEREDWGWGGGEGTVTTVFTCPGQHDGQPQQPLLLFGCPQPLQVHAPSLGHHQCMR